MHVIQGRNANSILPRALDNLKRNGIERDSRNGKVTKFIGPCTIVFEKPLERVVFWPERDANPFFHLVESVWMLAGRNTVNPLIIYVKKMMDFSDDTYMFNGAYGYRWRHHFGFDQVKAIIKELKNNPDSRQAVLTMWDAEDLILRTHDKPCNDLAVFSVNEEGQLDMTVYNRSNDIIWGALGANCVHFSFLQEYIAHGVGVPVGKYWQVSNNMHGYHDTLNPLLDKMAEHFDFYSGVIQEPYAYYQNGKAEPASLSISNIEQFDEECNMFIDELIKNGETAGNPNGRYKEPFFTHLLIPLVNAHALMRQLPKGIPRRYQEPIDMIEENCIPSDWKVACLEWLERRKQHALRN